jgi:hypothetical protein
LVSSTGMPTPGRLKERRAGKSEWTLKTIVQHGHKPQ